MKTQEQLIQMASAFEVLPYSSRLRPELPLCRLRNVKVEKRNDDLWAIIGDGCCLTKTNDWTYEPMPSNRNEEFLKECRWDNLQEAIKFAEQHLLTYPTGYKDYGDES
jgi:hypothetical protein